MTLPAIPTIDDLYNRFATLLQQAMVEAQADGAEMSASDIVIARSNLKAQAFVEAVGIQGAYKYIRDFVAKQAIPTKSSGEYLDDWLVAYGIPRKEATASVGPASSTGTPGAVLRAGTLMQRQDGTTYLVQVDSMVTVDGTVAASLICTTAGANGNLAAGQKLTLISSDSNIDAEFTVGTDGIANGVDRELDVDAIYRLHQRLSNPPRGSAPSDYVRWALSVPGITRAWAVRNPSGPTSVAVLIMADANEYGLPTEAQKNAVFDYIRNPDRGPPDELFVIIPAAKFIDVVLGISPDTPAARAAIELQLKDLFYREAVPGGRIPLSHLAEEISIAPGEFDHEQFEPEPVSGGFLFSTAFEILVLRSVTFQAMTGG
jgi:uncharacterized phage protein gp47/JayE